MSTMLAVVQFDSASVPLLQELLDEGRLPALASLRDRGTWHTLEAPDSDLAAAVYHTLYTGLEVSEHGLYHTFQWQAQEQRLRFIDSLPKPESIWERLSRAGRRSLIVDPYVHWRPQTMSGLCLSGWQFRNRIILQGWSVPAGARRRLSRTLGRPPLMEETLGAPSFRGLMKLSDRLLAAPARAADAVVELLGRETYDFLWVTLAPAHFAGHWLWDPAQLFDGQLSDAERADLERRLPAVYEAVDAAVARIVAALPEDADVIVMSPVGIGPNTSRSDLLPGMLEAVLGTNGHDESQAASGSRLWRMRAAVPASVRGAFTRVLPAAANRELVARLYLRGIDWTKTQAFALPGDTHGLVRLNIRGRERDGIVDPADEEALLEKIKAGLSSFRDPDGSPSVVGVERLRDRFPAGRRSDVLPDLIVHWGDRPSIGLSRVSSPDYGDVSRNGVGTGWPGNHRDEAWAIVAPGRSRERSLARAPRIVDVAATAASLLGADETGLTGETLLESA